MINNTKEEILKNFGIGWHKLLDKVYTVQYHLAFPTHISSVERKNGMLKVSFDRALTSEEQQFILDSIEYRIERLTAKICEQCGKYGLRRTTLPETQTLCTACYAIKYSECNTSVPLLAANQEPHTE
jgi:hypothetical protein